MFRQQGKGQPIELTVIVKSDDLRRPPSSHETDNAEYKPSQKGGYIPLEEKENLSS